MSDGTVFGHYIIDERTTPAAGRAAHFPATVEEMAKQQAALARPGHDRPGRPATHRQPPVPTPRGPSTCTAGRVATSSSAIADAQSRGLARWGSTSSRAAPHRGEDDREPSGDLGPALLSSAIPAPSSAGRMTPATVEIASAAMDVLRSKAENRSTRPAERRHGAGSEPTRSRPRRRNPPRRRGGGALPFGLSFTRPSVLTRWTGTVYRAARQAWWRGSIARLAPG
jgi:hypothetical protein